MPGRVNFMFLRHVSDTPALAFFYIKKHVKYAALLPLSKKRWRVAGMLIRFF